MDTVETASKYSELIAILGSWAAIFTSVVAIIGYGSYLFSGWARRFALERYLKGEKEVGLDRGQRSILHLIANLGMTEAEILTASFQSNKIIRRLKTGDDTNLATGILLEWRGKS